MPSRWDASLRTRWQGGRTTGPPRQERRLGPCRIGPRSWRSRSTSSLLPAVLEEDRAGAPGQVQPGHPCAPEGGCEDHATGPGARGPRGHKAVAATLNPNRVAECMSSRLVAAGQPLEVPGQAGAAPHLDLPQPSTRTRSAAPWRWRSSTTPCSRGAAPWRWRSGTTPL